MIAAQPFSYDPTSSPPPPSSIHEYITALHTYHLSLQTTALEHIWDAAEEEVPLARSTSAVNPLTGDTVGDQGEPSGTRRASREIMTSPVKKAYRSMAVYDDSDLPNPLGHSREVSSSTNSDHLPDLSASTSSTSTSSSSSTTSSPRSNNSNELSHSLPPHSPISPSLHLDTPLRLLSSQDPNPLSSGGIIDLTSPPLLPPQPSFHRNDTTTSTDSSDSFSGLAESPWVSPQIFKGKENNQVELEFGRYLNVTKPQRGRTSPRLGPSPLTSHNTSMEPQTPSCPPPPSRTPPPLLPTVRPPSTSPVRGDTPPPGKIFRNVTFQRPHHKGGEGKGRGGNWCAEDESV